jgi:hypothetical protein
MREEKIDIGFTFDPGLFSVLGERKYTTYMEALNELVRNSIGYKGKKIKINITPNEITVKDDGVGMNQEDLSKEYFRVGKPTKDSTTGSLFGIGKFGCQGLSHQTKIITQKLGTTDEFHVQIDWEAARKAEEIEKSYKNAYKPDVTRKQSTSDKHGTTIILNNLKYKQENPFEFKDYIEKKLFPILISKQIEIKVNDEICIAKRPKGEKYKFDSETDFKIEGKEISAVTNASFGKVWGEFYLTEASDENAVHVFDRFGYRIDTYSEKDWLKLSNLTSGMGFKKRVVGIIYTTTEEMRDESLPQTKCLVLKSDRSAFFEEIPSFRDLTEYLKNIVKAVHEKWLKEYKDISAKKFEMVNKEMPAAGRELQDIISETGYVWKRDKEGVEKDVVRKHDIHKPTTPQHKPKFKMMQCPQCNAINYISIIDYDIYCKNPSEEAKRKMKKTWPCKCQYYLNPETDLYKRPGLPKKPGYITTKVMLGPGRSIDIHVEPLGKESDLAFYNPDLEYLGINNEHAFFIKSSEIGGKAIRIHLVLSGLYAIAKMREREAKVEFETEFNKLCSLAHNWKETGTIVKLTDIEE